MIEGRHRIPSDPASVLRLDQAGERSLAILDRRMMEVAAV